MQNYVFFVMALLCALTTKIRAQVDPLYRVAVHPTTIVEGEKVLVGWSAGVFEFTLLDWVGLFRQHKSNLDAEETKNVFFRGGETLFTVESPGLYEIRYLKPGHILQARSEIIRALPIIPDTREVRNFPASGSSIILFGDSLAAGVGKHTPEGDPASQLSKRLGRPVRNRGISGNTTAQALARVEKDVIAERPQIVILILGGNDLLQNVPEGIMLQNMRAIVRKLHDAGSIVIMAGIQGGLLTDRFMEEYHRIWEEEKPIHIPNILRGIVGNPLLTDFPDLVHPNDQGYAVIADRLLPAVRALYTPHPTLSISRVKEGWVRLEWIGTYALQRGPTPQGPWHEVVGSRQVSAHETPALQHPEFFRLSKE